MKNIKILICLIVITGILFSGCITNLTDKSTEKINTTSINTVSPTSTVTGTSQIDNLENKINSMQNQIDNLQTRINRVDLLEPSKNQLIPNVPFKVEVYIAEMQTPTSYLFKTNGEVKIDDGSGWTETAAYKLFRNNNTIKIDSLKYQFYGLILYDNYISTIYKNGWIGGVWEYKILAPTYNPITQQYELK